MSTIDQAGPRHADDDRDIAQLARHFDRPVAPAPSFSAALRARAIQPTTVTTAGPIAARPLPESAAPVRPMPVASIDDRHRRVGFTLLEIAAILVLISALVASAFVINAVGRPSNSGDLPGLSAQIGQSGADVNWGGDEGRSQYYGDTPVDATATPVELQIGDEATTTVGPGLVVDGSWYGWTVRDGADAFLRVNVETGEQVWSRPYRTWGTLAADGERIFAFLIDASDTPTPVPVAIDMESGEIAWRGPALTPFATSFVTDVIYLPQGEATPVSGSSTAAEAQPVGGERAYIDLTSEEHGPVIAGDMVYFTDGRATTVALGAADGAERWRDDRSDDFPTVFDYEDEVQSPIAGTIVANERHVFVWLPDDVIVSLDPATGEERGRSYTGGFIDSNRIILGMVLRGDRLVVLTVSSFVSEDWTLGNAAVSVIDAGTLDVLLTSEFVEGPAGFELVVTESSAFLMTLSDAGVPELVEVDLTTGAVSEPFGTGLLVWPGRLSGAGDTLIAAMSSGTVLYFSMETHELVERHGVAREQPATLVGSPVPVVDGRPIVVWKVGPNDPVPQAPEATPVP